MFESFLSDLEAKTFGMRDFRKHVHRVIEVSSSESDHVHRVLLRTGPPWPGPKGHVHRIFGTVTTEQGHTHGVRGWVESSEATQAGHKHAVRLVLRRERGHVHEVNAYTVD